MNSVDQIRDLLHRRIEALAGHDAEAANAHLHPDIVAFELAGPLQLPASQATDIEATQAWLDGFAEGPRVEMEQLVIEAEGSIAFCHSLNRFRGTRVDGQSIDLKMRSTLGLRKAGDEWLIVHGHTSLPR